MSMIREIEDARSQQIPGVGTLSRNMGRPSCLKSFIQWIRCTLSNQKKDRVKLGVCFSDTQRVQRGHPKIWALLRIFFLIPRLPVPMTLELNGSGIAWPGRSVDLLRAVSVWKWSNQVVSLATCIKENFVFPSSFATTFDHFTSLQKSWTLPQLRLHSSQSTHAVPHFDSRKNGKGPHSDDVFLELILTSFTA